LFGTPFGIKTPQSLFSIPYCLTIGVQFSHECALIFPITIYRQKTKRYLPQLRFKENKAISS